MQTLKLIISTVGRTTNTEASCANNNSNWKPKYYIFLRDLMPTELERKVVVLGSQGWSLHHTILELLPCCIPCKGTSDLLLLSNQLFFLHLTNPPLLLSRGWENIYNHTVCWRRVQFFRIIYDWCIFLHAQDVSVCNNYIFIHVILFSKTALTLTLLAPRNNGTALSRSPAGTSSTYAHTRTAIRICLTCTMKLLLHIRILISSWTSITTAAHSSHCLQIQIIWI